MSKVFKKLNWSLISNQDRYKTIDEVKNKIDTNEGYILNFNTFSDVSLSLMIEIEENNILKLYSALEESLIFSKGQSSDINIKSTKTCWILINISFIQGTGDSKRIIPNVPG